jgi:phage terminase large subunit
MKKRTDITGSAGLQGFAYDRLGLTKWKKLDEIFKTVEAGHRKILIRSCNGAGKTAALAAICNWKLSTNPKSLVLTTASSYTQVKRNLWGEIRKQAKSAGLFASSEIAETQIKLDDKHYAIGISPALAENAQGFHSESMLIVIDEATGVDRDIITALFGNITGEDSQIILAYNPINNESYPYEAELTNDWKVITISAFEHPNIIRKKEIIKGAVTRGWIDDMLPVWSYEAESHSDRSFEWNGKWWFLSAEVEARMFGQWSDMGSEGLIPKYLVDASQEAEVHFGIRAMGVDIARSGKDETVFAFFDGNVQLPFTTMRTNDLVLVAAKIKEFYDKGFREIAVDDSGVGGGVTDILRSYGITVHAVNFAQSAKGFLNTPTRKLGNARAEMYFHLLDELKKREVVLFDDKKLEQELVNLRLHPVTANNTFILEPKEELKSRLGRSPDRADATVLARYALKLRHYNKRPLFL